MQGQRKGLTGKYLKADQKIITMTDKHPPPTKYHHHLGLSPFCDNMSIFIPKRDYQGLVLRLIVCTYRDTNRDKH